MNRKHILSLATVALLLLSQSLYSQSEPLKMLNIDGVTTEVKILTDTPIGFYKTTATNKYYIENTKNNSGLVYLEKLALPATNGKNRGKLLVMFNDCVSVRTKASKSDISEGKIIQLINEYNLCETYSDNFELSEGQKKEQSYANQQGILNYDFGIGYYSQEQEFSVNANPSSTNSEGGFSAYFSVNISPKHLRNLTGRLFYDFTLQYNSKLSYEFSNFENDISSVQLTVGSKYYLCKSESKINPFIGASIGAIVLNYEYTDNSGVFFSTIDSSDTKLIYGLEVGAQIITDFEFTLSYYPDYSISIFRDDPLEINSKLKNLNFKLGYRF